MPLGTAISRRLSERRTGATAKVLSLDVTSLEKQVLTSRDRDPSEARKAAKHLNKYLAMAREAAVRPSNDKDAQRIADVLKRLQQLSDQVETQSETQSIRSQKRGILSFINQSKSNKQLDKRLDPPQPGPQFCEVAAAYSNKLAKKQVEDTVPPLKAPQLHSNTSTRSLSPTLSPTTSSGPILSGLTSQPSGPLPQLCTAPAANPISRTPSVEQCFGSPLSTALQLSMCSESSGEMMQGSDKASEVKKQQPVLDTVQESPQNSGQFSMSSISTFRQTLIKSPSAPEPVKAPVQAAEQAEEPVNEQLQLSDEFAELALLALQAEVELAEMEQHQQMSDSARSNPRRSNSGPPEIYNISEATAAAWTTNPFSNLYQIGENEEQDDDEEFWETAKVIATMPDRLQGGADRGAQHQKKERICDSAANLSDLFSKLDQYEGIQNCVAPKPRDQVMMQKPKTARNAPKKQQPPAYMLPQSSTRSNPDPHSNWSGAQMSQQQSVYAPATIGMPPPNPNQPPLSGKQRLMQQQEELRMLRQQVQTLRKKVHNPRVYPVAGQRAPQPPMPSPYPPQQPGYAASYQQPYQPVQQQQGVQYGQQPPMGYAAPPTAYRQYPQRCTSAQSQYPNYPPPCPAYMQDPVQLSRHASGDQPLHDLDAWRQQRGPSNKASGAPGGAQPLLPYHESRDNFSFKVRGVKGRVQGQTRDSIMEDIRQHGFQARPQSAMGP